ncbi:MAG TPA: MurR/RpiR family transcriptional regulator [Caldilineae bacterium]|nr:MurR/RpiR family transcriptional regulator [Caldilineae bacterium]
MFRERIRRIYPILPPSHRVIADFLLNSYQEAAFMSGSQLAQHLEVDPATVVRFSQRLGYSGYPELRQEMQELVRQEIRARYQPITEERTPGELFRRGIHNTRELLTQMISLDAAQEISQIVTRLAEARHIYLLGEGPEAYVIGLFGALLRGQGLDAREIPPGLYSMAEALWDVGQGDIVIGVLLEGEGVDPAAAIQFARERGAFTVAIVRAPNVAPARAAEITITCPQADPPLSSSLICTLIVLIIIAHTLATLHPRPEAQERTSQVREVMAKLDAIRRGTSSRR